MKTFFSQKKFILLSLFCLGLFSSCQEQQSIVNGIEEREANEIVVFLASKGIQAKKMLAVVQTEAVAGVAVGPLWNIFVNPDQVVEAMAILNRNGLPRIRGANLLALFAKQGLMTSDKEETIRYQAGLQEELKNIIRKIDGVIDADVQISFPPSETLPTPGAELPKIKAAVYVKHQGIFNDPNYHLETKIKRLLAGSIDGLDFENVSVISDQSRLTDVQLKPEMEPIAAKALAKESIIRIWSIEMTQNSAFRFRLIFFSLIFLIFGFGTFIGWLSYKHFSKPTKIPSSEEIPPETPPEEKF